MDTINVSTNLDDYAPASTAIITATAFATGSTIEFQVLHVLDAGPDGIYGTLDDTIDVITNASGDGHDAWYITDGVRTAGDDGIFGNESDQMLLTLQNLRIPTRRKHSEHGLFS